MDLLAILASVSLWKVGESTMGSAVRAARRLNVEHFDNVISAVLPLEPVGGRDETLYDHLEHDEVVFLDKACARNSSYADHLRRELLLEQRCLLENENLPGIVGGRNYYHFYLQWNVSNAIDCTKGATVDFEAFCISKIEFEPILYGSSESGECRATPVPWESGSWFLDDIEGDLGQNFQDNVYHSAFFGEEGQNTIIYVLDSYTLLEHEHFDHIPDANKVHIGRPAYFEDTSTHGTHVTGTIVGNKYGVIRDPAVKVRVCNAIPNGAGSISLIESCMFAARDDLENERKSNPSARGVINMSLGGRKGGTDECTDFFYGAVMALLDVGGITVTSAGNSHADACNFIPACLPETISVGAYHWDHRRAHFSNFGDCVDAWAPGSVIRSSIPPQGYANWFGTSMASPIVSATVATLMNVKPQITLGELKDIFADYDGQHSFPIADCKSTVCNALSVQCHDLLHLPLTFSPTVSPRPTEDPTAPTSEPSATPTEQMAEIACGDDFSGSMVRGDLVSFRFINSLVQNVTFTNCLSTFNTKMVLLLDGEEIQDQSTNYCDDDGCNSAAIDMCDFWGSGNRQTETYTMQPLDIGTYRLLLGVDEGSEGGDWTISVHCGPHPFEPTSEPTKGPTRSPTPLLCPAGSSQVNDDLNDIAGCGLTACDDRHSYSVIDECHDACTARSDCVSFTWTASEGVTTCTLYDIVTPDQHQPDGHQQIMCIPDVQCPDGSISFPDSDLNDIAGCGLTGCDEPSRFQLSAGECLSACNARSDCASFTWAPMNGDSDHQGVSTCTLYSEAVPNQQWGPQQIMCIPLRIRCGETLSGSVGNRPDSVWYHFVNDEAQDVTLTNCDSNFDTNMFLMDAEGHRIQDQSDNQCGGDDCADGYYCTRRGRETFTMRQLDVGAYSVMITPYSVGGEWSLTVICHSDDVLRQQTSAPSASPTTAAAMTIECGQTLSGSIGYSPDSVSRLFINERVQDVTFTDCDSTFDPKMFLIDSDDNRIQQLSTNQCGGDDCDDPAVCSVRHRETFTMNNLEIGSYDLLLTPFNGGGTWSMTVQCHDPSSSAKAAAHQHSHDHSHDHIHSHDDHEHPTMFPTISTADTAAELDESMVTFTAKDVVIFVMVIANLVTIMMAYCMSTRSRPRQYAKGNNTHVVAIEGDTDLDLEEVALKQCNDR